MSYAFIECQPHAHSMELKRCDRCRRVADHTLHYPDKCENYCNEHKPTEDRHGQPVEWNG